ncbi:hypothetical protein ACFLQN_03100 [Candidatus Aenigmatarchaeota archaeon]
MARKNVKSGSTCSCSAGYMILAVILGTLGLFGVLNGFIIHFSGVTLWQALGWYFIGVILISLAKLCKLKCCACAHHHM